MRRMLPARNSSPTRMLGPGCQQPPSWSARSCRHGLVSCIGPTPWLPSPWRRWPQVLAVVLLGDREQAAGRALHRVAHRVVAEDVAKAGLLLEDRAGQRDGQARAPGLAHDDGLEAPAVARGWRARAASPPEGRSPPPPTAVPVALVGEVMAQALRVRRAVGLGARELRGRALLRGPDDEAEGAHVARGLDAEHAAHAPEGARGVLAPLAVHLDALVRSRGPPDGRSDWTAGRRRKPAASPLHRAPP